MQSLMVKGEISNCKYHSSGHIYFTLKDSKGTINCVMFAGNSKSLTFRMADGQQVIVSGTVDVYERDGKYQLYAKQIILDGAGALYEKFEALKKELAELGMFAPEYKQPIPKFIKTLGVVTAETGAAVRDIIQIASRRNPYVQIILYPAIVQGEAAAPSIIQGIHVLESLSVDVMIVGRGGGSIEDLWAFNERSVAQAVFDCRIPIISAVGHETDTTIIDFVSDLRAPTPSAAAELAVTDIRDIEGVLNEYRYQMEQAILRKIKAARDNCVFYERQFKVLSPMNKVREQRMRSASLEDKLSTRMQQILQDKRHELQMYIERLKGLSPLDKLNSGFSYVENEEGQNVRYISQVSVGENIKVRVSDGVICAAVKEAFEEKRL